VSHGWPGSILELLKVIEPLTDPTAHGGEAEDAFHLVIPSLPGYGFSARAETTGWNPDRIARAWDELMHRFWIRALRDPGWRLVGARHRTDEATGAARIARPTSRRSYSCIKVSRSGRTAAISKSPRRKTRCWTTSRCTG